MTEPMTRKRFLQLPMDTRREILRLQARLLDGYLEGVKDNQDISKACEESVYKTGWRHGREEMGQELLAWVKRKCSLSQGVTVFDVEVWLNGR